MFTSLSLNLVSNHLYTVNLSVKRILSPGKNHGHFLDVCCDPGAGCKGQSFYAVYDGHCGIRVRDRSSIRGALILSCHLFSYMNAYMQAAQYAADKLHKYILQHPMFKTDCKRAVSDACGQVDEEFVDLARQKDIYDGTTAVFALLVKSHAVIATIGDSYCVCFVLFVVRSLFCFVVCFRHP